MTGAKKIEELIKEMPQLSRPSNDSGAAIEVYVGLLNVALGITANALERHDSEIQVLEDRIRELERSDVGEEVKKITEELKIFGETDTLISANDLKDTIRYYVKRLENLS